jgi:hypothetical protein
MLVPEFDTHFPSSTKPMESGRLERWVGSSVDGWAINYLALKSELPHSRTLNREKPTANSQKHRLSLRNNQINFDTSRKLPIPFEEFTEYYTYSSIWRRRTERCQHVTGWFWKLWEFNWLCQFQMHRLSSRNNRVKFATSGKLLIHLEEFAQNIFLSLTKENQTMSTCKLINWLLVLETWGSRLIN